MDDKENILLNKSYALNQKGEVNVEIQRMPYESDTVEIIATYEDCVMSQIVNRITSQNHHFMSIKVLTKS